MSRAVKYAIATAVALIAIAAPAAASAASLKVTLPSKVHKGTQFKYRASGTGNFAHNYFAIFLGSAKCKNTYAAEFKAAGKPGITAFVGRSFTAKIPVRLNSVGTVWFCTYLYPKVAKGNTTWPFKPPEAKNSHKVIITR